MRLAYVLHILAPILAIVLAGCAGSRSMNETHPNGIQLDATELLLEVPTPDVLGSKAFEYANDGPETVALHAKTGILCRVPAHEACRVSWEGDHYKATRWRSAP